MTTSPNNTPNLSSSPINSTATTLNQFSSYFVISLNLPIAIKLNESNFLTLKSQILPLIHGYDLGFFLNSTPLDTTVRSPNGQIEINLSYLPWHRQDQLLLGWLRSSLTETLLAQVVSLTTTRDFWHFLEDYYAQVVQMS
jgi:hypothetical protein